MSSLTNKGGIYEDVIKGFEEKFKTFKLELSIGTINEGDITFLINRCSGVQIT